MSTECRGCSRALTSRWLRAQAHRVDTSDDTMPKLNTTSLTTASKALSTCSMRVEREPSRRVSKKVSGRSRLPFIQRSLAACARFRCSQMNSSGSWGASNRSRASLESISRPGSPERNRKPYNRP
ncbi:hypothetical protein D3C80_1868720 [compost metagenome]